jgi:hypothetical protein
MPTQTVYALFDDLAQAEGAIRALSTAGFPIEQISLLTQDDEEHHREQELRTILEAPALPTRATAVGAAAGGAGGLVAGLLTLAIPGLGPILAVGPLAAVLGAALGAGAGNLAGNLGAGERAHTYERSIQMGNVLLAVAAEEADAGRAEELLAELEGREIYRAA